MIRKSATGVIVALAVIWGGGTWYTGTQIQPGVEKFIKDFNDAKKKGEHAYDMTLSYQNFDKGFFNSRFQMQMTFDNGAPDLNIKPGQKVVFDVDVEHGPLPITMLMHGNVIPALAAAKVNLVNNELTQPLFIAAKNKSPVEATLRFAFGGSFSTTLDVTLQNMESFLLVRASLLLMVMVVHYLTWILKAKSKILFWNYRH